MSFITFHNLIFQLKKKKGSLGAFPPTVNV